MSVENGRECGDGAAAYVLGALEPSEAEAFRAHLAECAACREEVAAFERVTGALPADAGRAEVPRELRSRVMREVRATPRVTVVGQPRVRAARSWRPLAAWAGALATVAAVIVAIAVATGGSSGPRVIRASVGSAELRIAGSRADLIVHQLPRLSGGFIYEMWVQRGNGKPVPTGTLFSTTSGGTASVGVPGGVHGVSAVLVTAEPAGGTPVPTGAPVIVAHVT